jgi:hypothetical protein
MATLAELLPPQYGYVMIVASVSHMAILDILLVQLLAVVTFEALTEYSVCLLCLKLLVFTGLYLGSRVMVSEVKVSARSCDGHTNASIIAYVPCSQAVRKQVFTGEFLKTAGVSLDTLSIRCNFR